MTFDTIKPLFDDVDIFKYQGRFKVQLEIPPESTLGRSDIEKIVAISSWDVNPQKFCQRHEGVRGIVIERDDPISKSGINLASLLISGIGHLPVIFNNDSVGHLDLDGIFLPPDRTNFMETLGNEDLMVTGYAEGGKLMTSTPAYRARGTYTEDELIAKVSKTKIISSKTFNKTLVPHVEAYGRFLDEELRNGNPFGFVIFPVPDASKYREVSFVDAELKGGINMNPPQISISQSIAKLMQSIREIHDGGYSHLQLHLSNFYNLAKPYIMDWATMTTLDGGSAQNLLNRAIDIIAPLRNIEDLFLYHSGCRMPNIPRDDILIYMMGMYAHDVREMHEIVKIGTEITPRPQIREIAALLSVAGFK